MTKNSVSSSHGYSVSSIGEYSISSYVRSARIEEEGETTAMKVRIQVILEDDEGHVLDTHDVFSF